ncbi:HNH endonuclease [Pectobacterium brasiliense]|uniref:HNH endonuclease n=1 Tax=Pectobacterium brasiliense TaxID=180957 RepID=UPI0025A12D80|nr:HNH endonuclease [Pectobacterium brasiliense]WJM80435.1 HNH endonuclease [Pectobacterium brasiliense]
MAKEPSVDFLRDCFSYNPCTGVITWLPRPRIHFATERVFKTWHSRFCGKVAGGVNCKGYIEIGIQGRLMKAHRVAWAMSYGEYPSGDIDHINGVRSDNRLDNLRDVDRKANCRNRARHKNNTSGINGVRWSNRENRWAAEIYIDGKQRHLGYYANIIDATAARKSAELQLGYHENHGRTQ